MSEIEELQAQIRDLNIQKSTIQHIITQLTMQRDAIEQQLWQKTYALTRRRMEQIRESNPELYIELNTPLPLGRAAKRVLH